MHYPEAIYLDTNILRKLKKEIDAPEFQVLKNICDNLKISIFVPQLVLEEWIFYYTNEKVKEDFKQIHSLLKRLNSYIVSKEDISVKINENKIIEELEDYLKNQITRVGIGIIQRPKIKLDTLIKRSIKKIRPFKDGDKGFRDTIILYSILSHAKKFQKGVHLFITEDGDFDYPDVFKTASEFGIKLIIFKSLEEAKNYVQEFLKKAYKGYIMMRTKKAEDFLVSNSQEIITFVRKYGTFSDMFFLTELSKDAFFKTIKRINNIDLIEIYKINVGFLPEGLKEGTIEISFVARLKLFISVEIAQRFLPPKLSLGIDRDIAILYSILQQTPKEQKAEEEEIIVKDLSIYAEAKVNSEENFSNLKITNLLTS
jgi:predicted nucleic acid-binding protein